MALHEVVQESECEIGNLHLTMEEGRSLVEHNAKVPKLAIGWMPLHRSVC